MCEGLECSKRKEMLFCRGVRRKLWADEFYNTNIDPIGIALLAWGWIAVKDAASYQTKAAGGYVVVKRAWFEEVVEHVRGRHQIRRSIG